MGHSGNSSHRSRNASEDFCCIASVTDLWSRLRFQRQWRRVSILLLLRVRVRPHSLHAYLPRSCASLPWSGLFGEGPAERRDRLRDLLTKLGPQFLKRKGEHQIEEKEAVKEVVCSSRQTIRSAM